MELLTILTNDNPILKQQSVECVLPSKDIEELSKNMFYTMKMSKGIGLAAPQVGKLLKVVTIDTTSVGGQTLCIMINPVIVHSYGHTTIEEGCLSFPGQSIRTSRAAKVDVVYQDYLGNTKNKTLTGIDAVCVAHEIDHLNGITFQSRAAYE